MDENGHISLKNIVINPSSPPQYVFSTVYILTNLPGLPPSARRALNLPGTEYFIVVDLSMIIWKIDIAPNTPTGFSSSPSLNPTNVVLYNLLHFDSNYFLASMNAPTLKLIQKSDITVLATISLSSAPQASGLNNLNNSEYYTITSSGNLLGCLDINSSIATGNLVQARTSIPLNTFIMNNIMKSNKKININKLLVKVHQQQRI